MFDFMKKLDRRQRFIMFTCYFAFFVNGMVTMTQGSALPDIRETYGLSASVSGILLSAHSIGNLIAGFISGIVPLYLGRKRSIFLLHSLTFIGFVMMVLFGNPVWLFLAFVFTGLGRGSVTNFNSRQVNLLTSGSPSASLILHAVFAVGAILAPMTFLLLRGTLGWRSGLILVVLLGCISLSNMLRMDLAADERPSRGDKQNSTLVFLKNPSYLILVAMMFFYLCGEYSLNGWLVTYIQNKESLLASLAASGSDARALSQAMATLLWTVMLIGRVGCAILSTRIDQKKIMMVCSFGMAGFFFMLLKASTVPMVSAAVALMGLSMAGICPMIYSDAAIFTNTYPMATSMILGIGSIGGIAMPTVVGAMADAYGFDGGMSAILITVVLLVVFSVLNVVVKTHYTPEMLKNRHS